MKIYIYLSGSIKKGINDSQNKTYWTGEDINTMNSVLAPRFEPVYLNPSVRNDDLSSTDTAFGRDLLQVYLSDIVFVDARSKKGIGIGAEMMFAKTYGIPVLSIVPEESYYRRTNFEYLGQQIDNWTHPFISGLSDFICSSVNEAAEYVLYNYPFKKGIKNNNHFLECISNYLDSQLHNDREMLELISQDQGLKNKITKIKI